MLSSSGLTTAEVLAVFTEEVVARQGRVTDTFDDGQRLFTRSIVPLVAEVRPGDKLQGGVALKATEEGVCLYPYIFRLVCKNGAIAAQTLEVRALESLHFQEPEAALESIREGVGACCAEEVFSNTVQRTSRTASTDKADFALNLLPYLSQLAAVKNVNLVPLILAEFFRERDPSQFGLANAVTAVARDTSDPDLRWNLEELGGAIAIGSAPQRPASGGRSARKESRQEVLVG